MANPNIERMTNELTCTQLGNDLVVGTLKHQPEAVIVIAEEAQRFVPERTCQQVDVSEKYQPYVTHMTACSLCGETLAVEEYPAPNYCHSCGAKVVVEE